MDVGPDVPSDDEEIAAKGSNISDTKVKQEKERVQQVGLIANYLMFCTCMLPDLHVHVYVAVC